MLKNMADKKSTNPPGGSPPGDSSSPVSARVDDAFVAPAALAVWADIKRLGLEGHIGELETLGYTVVPPHKVAPRDTIDAVREKILDVAEKRTGVRPDLEQEPAIYDPESAFGQIHFGLLFEDPLFEQVVQNQTILALATYLLGRSAVLMSANAIIKGRGEESLALHTDFTRAAAPYPPHAQVANATWIFSDYNLENGSICFVPGSHTYCRPPQPGEGEEHRAWVEAEAGSLIFFSGHTWHGAFPRSRPGVRVSMTMPFCRPYIKPLEALREMVTDEMVARNPKRFATLMGKDIALSFGIDGPDPRYGIESHMMGRHVYD